MRPKDCLKYYPPNEDECETIVGGIRVDRFVDESECQVCGLGATDHTFGWVVNHKICVKDALKHGYKIEWALHKEVDMPEETKVETTQTAPAAPPAEVNPPAEAKEEKTAVAVVDQAAGPAKDGEPIELHPGDTPPASPPPGPAVSDDDKEVKIVITYRKKASLVGIQRTGSDPLFYKIEGDLPALFPALEGFFEEAKTKWAANFQYPKTVIVKPPAPKTETKTGPTYKPPSSTASKPAAEKPKPTLQNRMF